MPIFRCFDWHTPCFTAPRLKRAPQPASKVIGVGSIKHILDRIAAIAQFVQEGKDGIFI
jgi:hypothetical protein